MEGCIWILTTAQFVIQKPGGFGSLTASAVHPSNFAGQPKIALESQDFLVAKDLAPILDRINDHDLISYTTSGQSCRRGSFSTSKNMGVQIGLSERRKSIQGSNFLAGRKGSLLYKAVWEGQKHVPRMQMSREHYRAVIQKIENDQMQRPRQ